MASLSECWKAERKNSCGKSFERDGGEERRGKKPPLGEEEEEEVGLRSWGQSGKYPNVHCTICLGEKG